MTFRKSSYSGGDDNCVEVGVAGGPVVLIRDSKDPSGLALVFGREAHSAFIDAVAAGEFDFGLL
ncbi:DUF397 domain-containing protein [Kitasatospora sp. NPDC048722]|uniref:DUF397 domain-containing protein n=1 Tax=Kitasatospora sp. NPDC048722 TaxID=3155639 RepID=UPI0033F8903F